mmetsp:Transcript_7525/g.13201  ORF Transcript_7525/g.13201 Transcript_7525/m.13201 type:complete len:677 (-) Transcript_7525:1979-4009(-)
MTEEKAAEEKSRGQDAELTPKKEKKLHEHKKKHKKKHKKGNKTEAETEYKEPKVASGVVDYIVDNDEENGVSNVTKNSDNADANKEENQLTSLHRYYGSRKGFFATLSMILNAGLMVYAHVGLSAVVLSSRPPISGEQTAPAGTTPPITGDNFTGLCDDQDLMIWEDQGGRVNRSLHSNFCSREYNGEGCLLDQLCIQECFAATFGYSANCSTCFSAIPQCSFETGCALTCAADSFSVECKECNLPCTRQLETCMGFPSTSVSNETAAGDRYLQAEGDECTIVDLDSVDEWYIVYQLTFINGVQKAWNGDAKFLAFLVVLFSGIWPYAKNLVLVYLWYRPMTVEQRTSILTWLLRLSKYTLVDVFAIIAVLAGVLLELNVGGLEVATRAEPRPSIIAFFVATLWEFTQIELTVHLHNRHVRYRGDDEIQGDSRTKERAPTDSDHLLSSMRFRTSLWSNKKTLAPTNLAALCAWVVFLFVFSLATYLSGAVTELIRFTSLGAGDTLGCKRSYNLVTFGNAMVSELALTDNSALAGTWTLYVAYVILVLCLPIVVHILQSVILVMSFLGIDKDRYKRVCQVTSSLWGFSSVEVLLLGIFAIEYRFEKFVSALAGNDNSRFFSITSSLGPAFFILIVYSFVSGLLQYFIHCADTEFYRIDPYHKVHIMWTKLMSCWLEK